MRSSATTEDLPHASFTGQHKHDLQHKNVSYLKSILIGFVHGLAGSGAMVLLTMSTVNRAWEGAVYILIFGAGTVIGMLFFTTITGVPFVSYVFGLKVGMNVEESI